jgi:hypothetical protein
MTTARWWPLLLTFGCFLLARPYEGLVHDARLYIGFAVAPLDPSGIGADLLFRYDEQSGRSLYPVVLRTLVRWSSPSQAAFGVTIACLLLWFFGSWRLIRQLFPDCTPVRVGALLLVATSIQTFYGGSTTFRVAESFASPRVLAEGLVFIALASALTRSWIASALALLLALVVHPLMAVAGVAVVCWLAIPSARMRSGALVLAVVAMLVIVALTGVVPVAPLQRYDADWLRALESVEALVFLKYWEPLDWSRITVHVVTVALALPEFSAKARHLSVAIVMTAVAGVLASVAGADLVHNVLITQAQPWRALWLLAFVAGLSLGWLILRVVLERPASYSAAAGYRQAAVWMLLIGWFMQAVSPAAAIAAMLAALLWYIPVVRPSMAMPEALPQSLRVFVPGLIVCLVGMEARMVWQAYVGSPGQSMLWYWPTMVLAGVMRLGGVAIAWGLTAGEGVRRVSPSLASAVLLLSLWVFDSRSAYERSLEDALDRRVGASIAGGRGSDVVDDIPDGPVYWPDGEMEPWAFFGRPAYASSIQGTPLAFSRALALQWEARWQRVARLQSDAWAPQTRLRPDKLDSSDPAGIVTMCRKPDAPATVVLRRRPPWARVVREVELAVPQALMEKEPGSPWEVRRILYLVSCDVIRAAIPAS